MRFQSRELSDAELDQAIRWVERPPVGRELLAPRAWTTPRIEAWLDWADRLPSAWPAAELPEALRPGQPCGPLLGGALERYARRLAAWGLAGAVFESAEDALAFQDALIASMATGEAAPAGGPTAGAGPAL